MGDCSETTGYFGSDGVTLYGTFHETGEPKAKGGILVIPPFGEERKCAYRLIVETARRLADAGFDVMRFDCSGTGESLGSHAAVTMKDWIRDAGLALEQLQTLSSAGRWVLLGARLGANIAALRGGSGIRGIACWEPLLSGTAFLDEIARRKQIKAIISGHGAGPQDGEWLWQEEQVVDFDGFPVNTEFAAAVKRLDFCADLDKVGETDVLVVHVTGARSLPPAWQAVDAACRAHARRRLQVIHDKAFWGRADYYQSEELVTATVDFCLAVCNT